MMRQGHKIASHRYVATAKSAVSSSEKKRMSLAVRAALPSWTDSS
jgi:hypothetical protein